MISRTYLVAVPLILALAACRPGTAEYSKAEAPNKVDVSSAATHFALRFAPGSDHLTYRSAWRLRHMAKIGEIRSSDRVTVSAAGAPALAARRTAAVSRVLSDYGIAAIARPLADVPRNWAIVDIGRYLVTLPRCPDFAQPPSADFTNALSSNFGCATETNLGQMVANPADLVSGVPLGPTAGQPATAAVNRYLEDKVKLPATSGVGPIALPSAGAPGGAGGSLSATGSQ